MKKLRKAVCVLLALLLALPAVSAVAMTETGRISLSYGSADNTASLVYSDDLFEGSSKTYNHALAKASLVVSLSAGTAKGTYDDPYAEQRDKNVRVAFSKMGFDSYAAYAYDKPFADSSDTAASAIASKVLSDGTVLVAIALRGTGYGGEWDSNFRLGDDELAVYDYHYGFMKSSEYVQSCLLNYIEKNKIDLSKAKVWISGYSRGACIADLLGAWLLDSDVIVPENLYVYTFGSSALVQSSLVTKEYPGIYNVLVQSDAVGHVVFPEYGYTRYGTTLYLPSRLLCADFYTELPAVAALFEEFSGEAYAPFSKQELLMYLLRKAAVGFVPTANAYVSKYQDTIISEFGKLLNSGGSSMPTMAGLLFSMLKSKMKSADPIGTDPVLSKQVDEFVEDLKKNLDACTLLHDHWAECYIAWMERAVPIADAYYTVFSTKADVDISVTDNAGKMLAEIKNNKENTDRVGIMVTIDSTGSKSLYIPMDGEYNIRLSGKAGDLVSASAVKYSGEMQLLETLPVSFALSDDGSVTLRYKNGGFVGSANDSTADLNGDSIVNAADLSMLLSSYGTEDKTSDLNGDGIVNAADLSMLLSEYGKKNL